MASPARRSRSAPVPPTPPPLAPIPLGARVIFVADAFDAMTSNRLYRAALSHVEALAEVERCSGTQFDPDVVTAFLAVIGTREPAVA
jgi:HD-GYP domain-containing protein (c-di-GMP phosphodiesterase class II)